MKRGINRDFIKETMMQLPTKGNLNRTLAYIPNIPCTYYMLCQNSKCHFHYNVTHCLKSHMYDKHFKWMQNLSCNDYVPWLIAQSLETNRDKEVSYDQLSPFSLFIEKSWFESWIILLITENLSNTEKHKSKIMQWHWFNSLCTV